MGEPEFAADAAQALRHIARNEAIKMYLLQNPPLYAALLRAARRFIGGETFLQCQEITQALNAEGYSVTIDFMGESTREEGAAQQATDEFLQAVRGIQEYQLIASISLDLSHIGLALDTDLAFKHASILAQAANEAGAELMISAEGSERTDAVLVAHQRLSERFAHVGVTLQANMYRTATDLEAALRRPGRIRLVKGAFEESAATAIPRGAALDAAYRAYMEVLLASGHSCSIATHDSVLLDHAHIFLQERNLDRAAIEFEMLYGVTPDRLEKVRSHGYSTRVYLPYGREWYLYLCHRLAEYPPNIFRALADAVEYARA